MNSSEGLNIMSMAGIHATVIAIVAGLLTGYALHERSMKEQMEIRVFQKAAEINGIDFGSLSGRTTVETYEPTSPPVWLPGEDFPVGWPRKLLSHVELKRDFEKLMKDEPIPIPGIDKRNNRSDHLVRVLAQMTNQYPFRDLIKIERGADGDGVLLRDGRREKGIQVFSNIEQTFQWSRDAYQTSHDMANLSRIHKVRLQEFLDEYYEVPVRKKRFSYLNRPSAESLIFNFTRVRDLATSVKSDIFQIRAYGTNVPIFWLLLFMAIAFIAAIICSPGLDIYRPGTRQIVFQILSFWIPSVIYLVSFIWILVFVF